MSNGQRKSSLFRAVNERIRDVSTQWDASHSVGFFCECANAECSELLDLTLADYEGIRAMTDCYVVLRGHESADGDGEHVVARSDDHVVVHHVTRPAGPPAAA